MAFEMSITQCFKSLCDLYTPDVQRVPVIQPKLERKQIKSHLKRKVYDTLFNFLREKKKTNYRNESSNECSNSFKSVKTRFSWYALKLRHLRKFDEANRLESLCNVLTQIQGFGAQDETIAVLQFLLKLKDLQYVEDNNIIGHDKQKLPVIPKRDEILQLPEGPLYYGDTRLVHQRFHYMHYPRSIFEAEPLESTCPENLMFESLPGTNQKQTGFFGVDGHLGDFHEKITSATLFGGLVQGRVSSLDMILDLPELPEETNSKALETRIPNSALYMSMDDEGFKSQDDSVSSSTPLDEDIGAESSFDSAFHSDYDTAIYEECLDMKISHYYTWETLCLGPGMKINPYLTEAGTDAFDHWNKAMLHSLKTAFPSIVVAPRVEISETELVKEIVNVMIAVPSINFILDLTDQCFTMRDGLYITGKTTEALQNLLDDFLTCGMYYYRLNVFSAPLVINSSYNYGLTFQAFIGAVQVALQYYRACILSLPQHLTLLELRVRCHNLFLEMRFLACLCRSDYPVTEETKDGYPTGINLLSFLYKQTLEASYSEHYPLMLSLLKQSCTPYLIFVQDWVYHGVYKDNFREFLIEVHDDYLQLRDKNYWTHGYTLTTDKTEESVPLFLKEIANDVFICGKSINLLKVCNRTHFLCNIDDIEIPRISLTFSQLELNILIMQCTTYASRMQEIARQYIVSRKQMKENLVRAKQDLINKAKQETANNLQRLQDRITELQKASEAKKRQELQFLKSQMEQDLKRRAKEKGNALQKDKVYMDRLTRQEGTLDEGQLELERQAREDLIAYYTKLGTEAAHREQKALWHVRRAKLEMTRNDFFLQQDKQWADDMERAKSDPRSVKVTTPVIAVPVNMKDQSLPKSAWHGIDGAYLQISGEESDAQASSLEGSQDNKNLPKWALKGLQRYGMVSPIKNTVYSPKSKPVMPAGRKTPGKHSLNASFTFDHDGDAEVETKSSIQTFDRMHATTESKPETSPEKSLVKSVHGHHANLETSQDETRHFQVKPVGNKHATYQSEPEPEHRPHNRQIDRMNVNAPSEEPEHQIAPILKVGSMHSTTESQAAEWKIKVQSEFGHVSQMSTQQIVKIPLSKKSELMSATKESLFSTDYGIKPRIRIQKDKSSSTESTATLDVIPRMKGSSQMSATKQSLFVDFDLKRVQMFKKRNIHGHSADSTVQKLLYQGSDKGLDDAENLAVNKVVPPNEELSWTQAFVEPYLDKFDFLNEPPRLSSSIPDLQYGGFGSYNNRQTDIEAHEYLPLPDVLKSTITGPLQAQISLVNRSVVNYFIEDLQLEDHFQALRRYLCMADGDFAEILCDILMEKLGTNPRPQDMVNPVFLNNCLNKAIRLSINVDDKYAESLSFVHQYVPKTMERLSPDVFDCIQLHYEVKWPLNIVITEKHIHGYVEVFSFMLQLKRVVWILKEVWHTLKRDGLVYKVHQSDQFRQIHLYRQEMQHFVKVMQEYISHQIVDVTWQEFQMTLKKHVNNLDDLHAAHTTYLDTAVFRCLLSKNASALMKIIQDIFRLILKFHRQLSSNTWYRDGNGRMCHKNYQTICKTYKFFVEHSSFLFNVVRKLALRGYEPHLHDLLLRLNFNNYYDKG